MTRVPVPDPARPRLERRARLGTVSAQEPGKFSMRLRALLALLMVACSTLHLGWPSLEGYAPKIQWVQIALLIGYAAVLVIAERPRGRTQTVRWLRAFVRRSDTLVVLVGLLFSWWWPAIDLAGALLFLSHSWMGYVWLLRRGVNPGLIFALSFAMLVFAGAGTLMLPAATPHDQPIRFVDALFTSTSASCVTGLTVRDTNLGFTRFGQSTIMVLIQLGGLGTILFGGLVALLLGSSLSLKAVHALADTAASSTASEDSVRKLVVFAGAVVVASEGLGALLLYFGWPGEWASGPSDLHQPGARVFHAVFHSVSAFCNAGFGTSTNNLESLRAHWTSHVVIAGLIVIGGLGLPLYANVAQIVRSKFLGQTMHRGVLVRLSLHSKFVIVGTLVLYLFGFVLIFISQVFQRNVGVELAALDAHFMSITARTAGFDTVLPSSLGPLSRFALMISMFVGGSPSSTAGGIKTVVAGTLAVMAWAAVLDRRSVHGFSRAITSEVVRKSATLLLFHLFLVLGVAGVLMVTEHGRFGPTGVGGDIAIMERLLFESVSACSTVGLTLDTSAGLSDAGKVSVSVGMFLGRVGSLAFLVALVGAVRRESARVEYPTEGVVLS